MDRRGLGAVARAIMDSNLYMTPGTADGAGQPRVSSVYYAVMGYTEFSWVSSPEATHLRNLKTRPQVGVVIFASRAPSGTGRAEYVSAIAEEPTGADLDRDVFSRRSRARGAGGRT